MTSLRETTAETNCSSGGLVFHRDKNNNISEWIGVEQLNEAIKNKTIELKNITIPPDGASDFVDNQFSLKFYQRTTAFGMSVLNYWDGQQWRSAGTLPWQDLLPIPEVMMVPKERRKLRLGA